MTFIEWATQRGFGLRKNEIDRFVSDTTQAAFEGWRAAMLWGENYHPDHKEGDIDNGPDAGMFRLNSQVVIGAIIVIWVLLIVWRGLTL
jgi:hypothetical protein